MARLVGVLSSAVAGGCWLVALFLPWTSRGALSTATLLDAVELVRRGVVDSLVPAGAALVLLAPALAGIALLALVGARGAVATTVRMTALLVGAAVSAVLAWRLVGGDPSRLGAGGWVAVAGIALGVVAVGGHLGNRPRTRTAAPPSH